MIIRLPSPRWVWLLTGIPFHGLRVTFARAQKLVFQTAYNERSPHTVNGRPY